MSQIPGGAPAQAQPEPVKEPQVGDLDLSKFFGPVPTEEPPVSNEAPVSETGNPAESGKPADEPAQQEPEVKNELAQALNEWRAERKVADAAKQEASSWRAKYEALQAEHEAVRNAPAFEDDPLAYVHSRKLKPEQVSEIVQLLAYDLNPAAAPEGFRFKVFEARQARKEREAEEARKAQEMERARAQEIQQLQAFVGSLDAAAATFEPGRFPANEDWYGDNRKAYVADLFKIANELAEEAQAQGRDADLTAATLAAKLEQRSAEKLAALEARRGKRKPQAEKPADIGRAPGTTQSTMSPVSTQGLNQGGPRPPALTEEDRIKRAIAAGFGGR